EEEEEEEEEPNQRHTRTGQAARTARTRRAHVVEPARRSLRPRREVQDAALSAPFPRATPVLHLQRCLPSSLIGTQHTLKPIGRRNGEGQGDERAISMGANCGSGTPVANLRTMAPTRGTEQARSHAEALLQQASPRAEPRLVQENRTA
ncbi:unnamed protein product, partial [Prorocentrum cordatum]